MVHDPVIPLLDIPRQKRIFLRRHTWVLMAPSTFTLKHKAPKWPSHVEHIHGCGVFAKWNAILYIAENKQLTTTHKNRNGSHIANVE